jgi:hypothetical protein
MRTFHRLLERFGFVRLADYGLLLTQDRRVLTTRKAVLDDGHGECIVGWTDGDLATLELAAWETPKPSPKALPKPPRRRIAASKSAVAEPAPPLPAPVVAPEPVAPPPGPVAPPAGAADPEPPVEEDEWEWEIAMARARATAAEPAPAVGEDEREWEVAMAHARATAADVVAEADAMLARKPVAVVARTPVAPIREPLPLPGPPVNDGSRPRTIIPVPALPAIDPRLVRSFDAPRRFPRATAERAAVRPPRSVRR